MKYKWLKVAMLVALFAVAMQFENAMPPRSQLLYGLMALLCASTFLNRKAHPVVFFIDIGVILGLNLYSQYVVSPLFLLMFGVVILDVMQTLKKPYHVMYAIFTLLALAYVLSRRFLYQLNYQSVAEVIFTAFMFATFAVMLFYVRSYREAKEDLEHINEKLCENNDALRASQRALEEARAEVARLAKLEERGRVARELHDTVGHDMTGLIMELEMLKLSATDEPQKTACQTVTRHARDILSALRQSVTAHVNETPLFEKLMQRIDKFKEQTGLTIHRHFEPIWHLVDDATGECLYRTVTEGLTNVAKHAGATEVWLSIQRFGEAQVLLKIVDNGKSGGAFDEGHGLKFIKERVVALGGDVTYRKDADGFAIVAKLNCFKRENMS